MAQARQFAGGCHCGKVRFEVTLSLDKVIECNCSICARVAALRAFAPAAAFKLLSDADALADYQFGRQHLHHQFCKVCGVHAFASGTGKDGVEMKAINVRCLDGVDLASLEISRFDGKKL